MRSVRNSRFRDQFAALTSESRRAVIAAYRLWKSDSTHPSLYFKPLAGDLWSARTSRGQRALAIRKPALWLWVWVGEHDEYVALLRNKRAHRHLDQP